MALCAGVQVDISVSVTGPGTASRYVTGSARAAPENGPAAKPVAARPPATPKATPVTWTVNEAHATERRRRKPERVVPE